MQNSIVDDIKQKLHSLITELRRQPIDRLFHYTTATGLQGILSSNSIWASNARYLNDTAEITYGCEQVSRIVSNRLQRHQDELTRRFLSRMNMGLSELYYDDFRYYVTCFCENGDLLSQWRAYSDQDGGYSIEFDFSNNRCFKPIGDQYNTFFRKVIYDPKDQEQLVNQMLDVVCGSLDSNLNMSAESENHLIETCVVALSSTFRELFAIFKSPTFSEEQEWRMIVQRSDSFDDNYDTLRFRTSRGILIPYLELGLSTADSEKFSFLPIANILCGPTLHERLNLHSINLLLEKYGYVVQGVDVSGATLRF